MATVAQVDFAIYWSKVSFLDMAMFYRDFEKKRELQLKLCVLIRKVSKEADETKTKRHPEQLLQKIWCEFNHSCIDERDKDIAKDCFNKFANVVHGTRAKRKRND